MKLAKPLRSPNVLIYLSIFLVTQVTGVLLSLVICFILRDFIWGFVRAALLNSLVLGAALVGTCHLTQRLVSRIRTVYIAGISFSLLLGVAIVSFLITLVLEPAMFVYYSHGAFSFLFVNFLFIAALHAISSGLILYREVMVQKEKAIGVERDLRNQMEMKLLSSRVNPHFLFNTLNMIIALLKQPAKAELALLDLSDLLRQNLEQSEFGSISIAAEVENVRKYLELQALRFGEKLHYDITVNADFLIPPLIIQPLVENSIKHNIQSVPRLSVAVVVSQDGRRGTVSVVDSCKAVSASMLNAGQGLTITKKRVENSNGTFAFQDGGILISFPT
jgi:hypothetical protein